MDNAKFMTGYEQRIFKGWEKTAADKLKDQKMLEVTLKKVLAHETEVPNLETGEVVNLPLMDLLVLKRIGYDLDHPKDIDLKVYSAVLGETKQDLNVTGEVASDLFKGVVAGAKPDGSSTRQSQPSHSKKLD